MRLLCAALLGLLLAGCANLAPLRETDVAGTLMPSALELDGTPVAAQWYLPSGKASALLVLEHGFTRACGHLRGTSRQLMGAGLSMGQIQSVSKEMFAVGREKAGEDAMGAIVGAIPGLGQFV